MNERWKLHKTLKIFWVLHHVSYCTSQIINNSWRENKGNQLWRRFCYVILIIVEFGELLLWISLRIINALRRYINLNARKSVSSQIQTLRSWLKKKTVRLVGFKVDRLQIIVVAKKISVMQLFISRMPKMCAIPQLVSAQLYLMKQSSLCLIYYIPQC